MLYENIQKEKFVYEIFLDLPKKSGKIKNCLLKYKL